MFCTYKETPVQLAASPRMKARSFQGIGRRVSDGGAVVAPPPSILERDKPAVCIVIAAVAVASCPSHDSFEIYLASAAQHPSGYLGGLAALAERIILAVSVETHAYILLRIGAHKGRHFVGIFGMWVPLPLLAFKVPRLSVCRDGEVPHEAFALLCIIGWVLATSAERYALRHGVCSLNAVRAGRIWTVLTANVVHFSPIHLLHNVMQVLTLGPVLHSALGCDVMAVLLLFSALTASVASLVWNGMVCRRPNEGSAGASGVAMGMIAANAALYPRVVVRLYGVEMHWAALPFVHLAIDAACCGVDLAAHAGGAACGWMLVRRWRGSWYTWGSGW
jgi:membrane associated rhomboid family serine protease